MLVPIGSPPRSSTQLPNILNCRDPRGPKTRARVCGRPTGRDHLSVSNPPCCRCADVRRRTSIPPRGELGRPAATSCPNPHLSPNTACTTPKRSTGDQAGGSGLESAHQAREGLTVPVSPGSPRRPKRVSTWLRRKRRQHSMDTPFSFTPISSIQLSVCATVSAHSSTAEGTETNDGQPICHSHRTFRSEWEVRLCHWRHQGIGMTIARFGRGSWPVQMLDPTARLPGRLGGDTRNGAAHGVWCGRRWSTSRQGRR